MSTLASAQAGTPDFDDVVARAAEAQAESNFNSAISLYRQALLMKPQWAEGWWLLGGLLYETGTYAAGRDVLAHAIELGFDPGPPLALKGLCEYETGEYRQSLADIQQGLALGAAAPHSQQEVVLRYHKAMLLAQKDDFEGALREYGVLAKDPITDPELLVSVGLAGLRLAMPPKDVPAEQRERLISAGTAAFHLMAGDEKKAQAEFETLFQRFPDLPNAHYLYGYLLFAGDPDRAVPEFEHELKIASTNAAAQVMLAWYYILREDPQEALPYAEKAAKEAPESPSAQLVFGRALEETGQVNDGLKHLEAALKIDPSNLEVHLALVKGYSELGRKEDAARERRQSLEMTKEAASATVHP
jgi:tetratricopeptide (TPR) repeat protein